jgi:uncharacterized protein
LSPPLHRCPTCRRELEWSASNLFRPFCSERCRLIDLGAWLKEEHAIPGEPAADPSAETADGAGEPLHTH